MDKYRFDDSTESVYEYSDFHSAYVYIGKLMGRTHKQFIEDYEEMEFNDE